MQIWGVKAPKVKSTLKWKCTCLQNTDSKKIICDVLMSIHQNDNRHHDNTRILDCRYLQANIRKYMIYSYGMHIRLYQIKDIIIHVSAEFLKFEMCPSCALPSFSWLLFLKMSNTSTCVFTLWISSWHFTQFPVNHPMNPINRDMKHDWSSKIVRFITSMPSVRNQVVVHPYAKENTTIQLAYA